MPTLAGICQNQMAGSNNSSRGSPARAGILQNADVAERLNAWPASRMLGAGQMALGQARLTLAAWPSCHLLRRLFQGSQSRVCGPFSWGRDMWWGWQSQWRALIRARPHRARASALPVRAYCSPVSKRINDTASEAGTLIQSFLNLRSCCSAVHRRPRSTCAPPSGTCTRHGSRCCAGRWIRGQRREHVPGEHGARILAGPQSRWKQALRGERGRPRETQPGFPVS